MNSFDRSDLTREPLATSPLTIDQKRQLTDVLDRYLKSLENGEPLDMEELISAHGDLAEPLREFLSRLDDLHQAAAGFVTDFADCPAESSDHPAIARRLGDFILGRELGRGGMGVVYEARQVSLDRQVAIKILPFAAVLDSTQIGRFKAEAQAAAQIRHANIVPVFAVGVDRGVHYYVMQLIDGQPLDRAIADMREQGRGRSKAFRFQEARNTIGGEPKDLWLEPSGGTCDQIRRPGLMADPSTLEPSSADYFRMVARLGIQAAEALHAAHEHGIVHRDVKPSNLLLDAAGKLWVTDFGLARCRFNSARSRTGDIIGTMRYMSPEQASGRSSLIDQRTDVYSLGATLYELCTLRPAVPGNDGPDLLGKIAADDPVQPRLWNPRVPAPLGQVILKSLAKDRADRYLTARDFADDLRRFHDGMPIVAQPLAALERAVRWAGRRRHLVAAIIGCVVVASLGLVVSTWLVTRQKSLAEHNFQRAEQNFRDARTAVDRFGTQFAQRLAGVPGASDVRKDLLQETLAYYHRFVDQANGNRALSVDVAQTYAKIGDLTDQTGCIDLAIRAHEQAVAAWQRLVTSQPAEASHRRQLAVCYNNLGIALRKAGRVDEARQAHERAIERHQELVRLSDSDRHPQDLAVSYTNLALLLSETGHIADAERAFREAIRVQQALTDADPADPRRHANLAGSYNNLSSIYLTADTDQARKCFETALQHLNQALATQPRNAEYSSQLAATHSNLGSLLARQQQFSAALEAHQQAIQLQQALADFFPAHLGYRRDLAISVNNSGLIQCRLEQPQQAVAAFRNAIALQQSIVVLNPHDVALRSSIGGVQNNLGIALEALGELADAADAYQAAVEQQQRAFQQAPGVTRYRLFLNKHYFNLGRVLRQLGRPDQALRVALRRRELWSQDPQRLLSIAEELALAGHLLPDSQDTTAAVIETLQLVVAIQGRLPAEKLDSEVFANVRADERFSRLMAQIQESMPHE